MEIRKTPDRRVLGDVGNLRLEPLSPTANLRLLTNLASSLKSSPMRIDQPNDVTLQDSSTQLIETPNRLGQQPRKDKSLRLLCNKFFKLYPLTPSNDTQKTIPLNETAMLLGTEKRRIYDIINILESLEMASKIGKNQYLWHGQTLLPVTLAKLKSLGVELGIQQYIQHIQSTNQSYMINLSDTHHSTESTTPNDRFVDHVAQNDLKSDKSLGIMCQKFLMLFLTSLKNCVVNLDIAVNFLLRESDQKKQDPTTNLNIKTKVRRLYDIANVLTAIGLIKKVNLKNSTLKKPIYVFTGPDVDDIDPNTEPSSYDNNRHTLIGMSTPKMKSYNSGEQKIDKDTPNTSSDDTNSSTKRSISRKRKLFSSGKKINSIGNYRCSIDDKIEIKDSPSLLVSNEFKNDEEAEPGARKKLFPSLDMDYEYIDPDDIRSLNIGSSVADRGESHHSNDNFEPIELIDCSNIEISSGVQLGADISQTNEGSVFKTCDKLKIPLAPHQQVLIKNRSSSETYFLILPGVSNKINFSADKFKAEIIDNVVQLVPLDDKGT